MASKLKRLSARKQRDNKRQEELQQLVTMLVTMLEDATEGDWKEMCNKTDLSLSTLRRLFFYDASLRMHAQTLLKLSGALGLSVEFTRSGILVSLEN